MADPRVSIKIPRALYQRVQDAVRDSGFSSPTEFIVFVLRDLMAERGANGSDALTRDEVHAVRARLKSLGYLPVSHDDRPPRGAEEV